MQKWLPASRTHGVVLVLSLAILHRTLAHNSSHDFLHPHNAARAEVGVGKLSWDTTLAAYARRYAGKRSYDCSLVHSRGSYGENLFWGSSGRRWTAADAVAKWVRERANYDCASNTCARGKVSGHYTQVIWAHTKRVGCAAVRCDDGGTFLVCSYDPPGNVHGEVPYPVCGDYGVAAV